MSETVKARGHCLCGQVEIITDEMSLSLGACHCNMCRRWGGGPYLTVECGTSVQFIGEEHIGRFDSSEWAQRGFCKNCGSCLFYYLKPRELYIMSAGLFGDDHDFDFDHQVFVEERPDFYCFANKTAEKTGAELFAEAQGD